jgi:hypothetical protein
MCPGDIARSASVHLLDSLPRISVLWRVQVLWADCQSRVFVSVPTERTVTGLLIEVVNSAALLRPESISASRTSQLSAVSAVPNFYEEVLHVLPLDSGVHGVVMC